MQRQNRNSNEQWFFFLIKISKYSSQKLCQNSLMNSKRENIQPQALMLYYCTELWKPLKPLLYLVFNTLNSIFTTQTWSSNTAQLKTNLRSLATYYSTIWQLQLSVFIHTPLQQHELQQQLRSEKRRWC